MSSLKEIRKRISSVRSTRQITSAMKMVAAARLRKAQDRIVKLRPYASKLQELLVDINMRIEQSEDEQMYSRVSDDERVLLIVVTSNRGLCGSFNMNVIKEAKRITEEKYMDQYHSNKLWIMTIGKKAWEIFRKTDYQIYEDQSKLFDDLNFENASSIADKIMDAFLNKEFERVEFVYNKFRNAAVQDLTVETFLPIETEETEDSVRTGEYIYEPSKEDIINELIPKTLKIQFYRTLLDSYVAEHGARMTAMHIATDNATELIRDLNLEYNKARQASITNQILEVANGSEALGG
ncbi:MAG TPA: ATP synthase F1 subunit gamma [Bacteroidales bacterium]|nr:ATP synthase F1 subunit gamma [Bacteroidales bacterium]